MMTKQDRAQLAADIVESEFALAAAVDERDLAVRTYECWLSKLAKERASLGAPSDATLCAFLAIGELARTKQAAVIALHEQLLTHYRALIRTLVLSLNECRN